MIYEIVGRFFLRNGCIKGCQDHSRIYLVGGIDEGLGLAVYFIVDAVDRAVDDVQGVVIGHIGLVGRCIGELIFFLYSFVERSLCVEHRIHQCFERRDFMRKEHKVVECELEATGSDLMFGSSG